MVQDKGFIIGVIAVSLLLLGGAIWYLSKETQPSQTLILPQEQVIRDSGYNVLGSQSAPVTIVEFSDPQCPACRMMDSTIKALFSEYPDSVKLVYRHFPLPIHNQAIPASRAIEAAGKQNKFFPMLEGLFENQASLSDDKIKEVASLIGLNIDKFNEDRNSEEIKQIVDNDKKTALDLDLPGTPTIFVNGKQIIFAKNESTLNRLKTEVNSILSQTQTLQTEKEETTPSAVAK